MIVNAVTRSDAAYITDVEEQVFDLEATYVDWVESEEQDDRRGVFHPSAVGMCARRNVYEYIGTPRVKAVKAADLETFRLGHAVHHLVQTILADLDRVLAPQGIEYTFYPEIPFDPDTDLLYHDLGIGGTCDGLLELHHTQLGWRQRGVVEIKSIKDELYKKLRGPKEDHLMQANLYAFRFDTPILWFWYYNKNNSERRVYRRLADDDALDNAISRFAEQRAHADAGTLPDRDESYYMCPRCEYGHVCKPNTLERVRTQEKIVQIRSKGGFGSRR